MKNRIILIFFVLMLAAGSSHAGGSASSASYVMTLESSIISPANSDTSVTINMDTYTIQLRLATAERKLQRFSYMRKEYQLRYAFDTSRILIYVTDRKPVQPATRARIESLYNSVEGWTDYLANIL